MTSCHMMLLIIKGMPHNSGLNWSPWLIQCWLTCHYWSNWVIWWTGFIATQRMLVSKGKARCLARWNMLLAKEILPGEWFLVALSHARWTSYSQISKTASHHMVFGSGLRSCCIAVHQVHLYGSERSVHHLFLYASLWAKGAVTTISLVMCPKNLCSRGTPLWWLHRSSWRLVFPWVTMQHWSSLLVVACPRIPSWWRSSSFFIWRNMWLTLVHLERGLWNQSNCYPQFHLNHVKWKNRLYVMKRWHHVVPMVSTLERKNLWWKASTTRWHLGRQLPKHMIKCASNDAKPGGLIRVLKCWFICTWKFN